MSRLVKTTLVFAVLSLSHSVFAAPIPVNLGVPFTLGPGQSAEVIGTDLYFAFMGILSDSRCPSGAICGWEGDAEAAVRGDLPGEIQIDCVLHTFRNFAQSCEMGNCQVTLLGVDPYPIVHIPIDPADYIARFIIVESGPADVDQTAWGSVKALYF